MKLAGKSHEGTGVVFDQRGLPVFDAVTRFEIRISSESVLVRNERLHMKEAILHLKSEIQAGRVSPFEFTPQQLQDIYAGRSKITDYTWHHHQDLGRMQLVPVSFHDVDHVGGMHLWFIGK